MALIRGLLFATAHVFVTLAMASVAWPSLFMGREAARVVAKAWAKTTLFLLWATTGVAMRVEGREHMPTGPAIVAANHQSMWETLALFALLPRPVMVLKKELARIPIFGTWLTGAGGVVIDREGGATALRGMVRAARARLTEGDQVVIFPEGTRAPAGTRLPIQPGVAGLYAASDAPCAVATHDSGRYWRHPGLEKVAGRVTLRFSPPIPPGLKRAAFLQRLDAAFDNDRPDAAGVAQGAARSPARENAA